MKLSQGHCGHQQSTQHAPGNDKGNGLFTKRTEFIQDNATGKRETIFAHDGKGKVLLETNPLSPHAFHKVDNMGRRIATGLFSSTASIVLGTDDPTTETANRLALDESFYDDQHQRWKTVRHKVDVADGSDDDNLETLTWHDASGRVIKQDTSSGLTKTAYDRLDRTVQHFVLADHNDTAYSDADDVTGDYVLEEHQTVYDTNTDNVLMRVAVLRHHDDYGSGETLGRLDTNADADDLLVTATNLEGRAQITAYWYDASWRQADVVSYGTNGGSNFDRDGLSVPARSDTALRTTYTYNTDGTLKEVTNPRGLVAKTEYDALRRRTKEIRNYNASVNSGNPANPDDNQTVIYEYTDGLLTSLTADLPSGETDQTTTYIYGTTKGTPSASQISTGHLLRAAKYPDSTNTGTTSANIDTDSSDVTSYAYNALGEFVYQKDQAGNVIELDLDDRGRETQRRVTTLATGFDGAVRRIARTYLSLGQSELVTQYDNATVGSGSVVDEVKYGYDGWAGVTKFEQDRNSAVGASGSVDDYEVSYSYEKATTGRNTIRRTGATLPSGKVITYSYTLNQNNAASLVGKVLDGAIILSKYDYMGVSWVVGENYHEPGLDSRRYGTGTANYTDLDRFNRIITSRWTTDASSRKDFYRVDLTYDRNSNITVADDGVHAGFDIQYTMDDLGRLTRAQEGTWGGGSISSEKRDQEWTTLTHTGNWTREKLDLNGDGDWGDGSEHDDTRSHNAADELTARDLDSTPGTTSDNYTITYDADGNLTDDGQSYKYEWDAFRRMRYIKNRSTSAVVAEYKYNGLGFQMSEHVDTDSDGDVDGSDKWFHRVTDASSRLLANFRDNDTSPKEEYTYHAAGRNGLEVGREGRLAICRNRDANTAWTAQADGVLEERLYVCHNALTHNVAIATSTKKLCEGTHYLGYSIPFSSPCGDVDSDGDCDSSDLTAIDTLISQSTYDARADADLDSDVDSTDKTIIQNNSLGVNLGLGSPSWKGIRIGTYGERRLATLGAPATHATVARDRIALALLGRLAEPYFQRYNSPLNRYLLSSSASGGQAQTGGDQVLFEVPTKPRRMTPAEQGELPQLKCETQQCDLPGKQAGQTCRWAYPITGPALKCPGSAAGGVIAWIIWMVERQDISCECGTSVCTTFDSVWYEAQEITDLSLTSFSENVVLVGEPGTYGASYHLNFGAKMFCADTPDTPTEKWCDTVPGVLTGRFTSTKTQPIYHSGAEVESWPQLIADLQWECCHFAPGDWATSGNCSPDCP